MNTRMWIPLCAAAVILAACGKHEEKSEGGEVTIETVPDNPVAPAEQSATPGGTAGETVAPAAEPPPPETRKPGE